MKINSIHIISFGKIKNLRLDFSDSLNIIYGDNEAGKTHIAEFIKMMFYGSGSRGQGVNNLRKKYKPWDNSKMGGSIDFTSDNTRYRLEREFKASNSSDTVTLHNLDSGASQNLSGSDNLGAQIFGISVSAFEQSVFIDNSVVFSGDNNSELNLKLSNLSNSTEEDISFEKLLKNISSAKESLISKNRKNGPIPELEAEIERLKAEKQNALSVYEKADEKADEISRLEEELIAESKEKSRLFEELKACDLCSLKEKLLEFRTAVSVYNEIEERLKLSDSSIANSEFLSKAEAALQELKFQNATLKEKMLERERDAEEISRLAEALPSKDGFITALQDKKSSLSAELEAVEKQISELSAEITLITKEKTTVKGGPNIPLIIIGALLTALGVIAGFFIPYLLPFAALGLVFAVLGFTVKKKPDFSELDAKIGDCEKRLAEQGAKKAELKDQKDKTDSDINAYIIKTNTDTSLLSSKKEEALKAQAELIVLNEEFERKKASVFAEIGRFKPCFDIPSAEAVLSELEATLNKLNEAQIRAQMAVSHTGCKSTEDAFRKLESMPDNLPEIHNTKEELQEKFNNSGKKCTLLSSEIAEQSAELKAMTKGIENPREFDRKIKEAKEKLDSMREFAECADIAADTLNKAYAELSRSFGGVLQTRALEIFSGLTDNTYRDMMISKDFDITVKKSDDIISHAVEYLSKGTVHQAYFALRLALAEFLCEDKESLPIILDDIFSQYDNERTALGFNFLKEYSKDNQVLFFTCHKELTENEDANLITL